MLLYLQGNIQKGTDKSIYKQCGKFGDSSKELFNKYHSIELQYLVIILKTLTQANQGTCILQPLCLNLDTSTKKYTLVHISLLYPRFCAQVTMFSFERESMIDFQSFRNSTLLLLFAPSIFQTFRRCCQKISFCSSVEPTTT